jgi:hypothetical protein
MQHSSTSAAHVLRRVVTKAEMERNMARIRIGFLRKGIPDGDIDPGRTIYSFEMWRKLGRTVRRGEHGVFSMCYRSMERRATDQCVLAEVARTTVFHISQTIPWRAGDRAGRALY